MENQTASEPSTPPKSGCVCRDLGMEIAALLGLGSEEARQHLRNARVEMLKAVRSMIDARIEHLSRAEHKGTKVSVE